MSAPTHSPTAVVVAVTNASTICWKISGDMGPLAGGSFIIYHSRPQTLSRELIQVSRCVNHLVKPGLHGLDPSIRVVQVKGRLGAAQQEVAVGPQKSGDLAGDRLLHLDLEIDHNVAHQDQVLTR